MLSVIGTVLKKERKQKRVELLVKDTFGNIHPFQVRNSNIIKLVELNEDDEVEVYYKIETREFFNKKSNEINRIPNEVLIDLKLL